MMQEPSRDVQGRATARPDGAKYLKLRLPLAAVAISLLVVGVGSLIRQRPSIGLDVTASEIHFTVAPESAPLASGRVLELTDFHVVGDPVAATVKGAVQLQSLLFLPNTTVSITRHDGDCYMILAEPGPGGIDFQVRLTGQSGGDPLRGFRVKPGTAIVLCGDFAQAPLVAGPVVALDVWQSYREGRPRIVLSSIEKGLLEVAETGQKIPLKSGDRLSISSVQNGWAVLEAGKLLHVTFAGECGSAVRMGISPFSRENLAPTLVDVASQSPAVKAVVSAVTGFVGVLWSVWGYFRRERS